MTNVMTGRAGESGPRNSRGVVRSGDFGRQAAPRSPVIGHWLLVIHWSLVIGHWSLAVARRQVEQCLLRIGFTTECIVLRVYLRNSQKSRLSTTLATTQV